MLVLNKTDLFNIDKELCERSLAEFVKQSWHVLEPANPYVHGWHIDAVCKHLESVSNGTINRLLMNVPPGTMKSLLVNVFWPAWEWGPNKMPHLRYIGASHELSLATRDSAKMRRLIESEWYQKRWPTILLDDQNTKTNFENTRTGFRIACPVRSMTGKRGDRVLWDDPLSAADANYDSSREEVITIFKETLPTRLVNPEKSSIVIIMQRLHQMDPSGYIIANAKDLGYEVLILPMEYEVLTDEEREKIIPFKSSIGFVDPRTEDGELLFPERFPQHVVDRDKAAMGDYAVAGQFQQRPIPRGGKMFPVEQFQIVKAINKDLIVQSVRYWDKAGSEPKKNKVNKGARTAGVLMHKLRNGKFLITDVVRGMWLASAREERIKQTAELDGVGVKVWVEQEPGSGGKESADNTITNLAGFSIRKERPVGDKIFRADPYSAQVQVGNVILLEGDWNRDFISEHENFPNGSTKDQVDACSGAFAKLNSNAVIQNGTYVGIESVSSVAKEFGRESANDESESLAVYHTTIPDW